MFDNGVVLALRQESPQVGPKIAQENVSTYTDRTDTQGLYALARWAEFCFIPAFRPIRTVLSPGWMEVTAARLDSTPVRLAGAHSGSATECSRVKRKCQRPRRVMAWIRFNWCLQTSWET